MLDARVWWPLFPLLLLVVIVCLTWALVVVVRRGEQGKGRWLQIGAFCCYFLAAVSAVASERRGLSFNIHLLASIFPASWELAGILQTGISVNVHRPFSILAQVCLALALIYHWKRGNRSLLWLNAVAWAGIVADASLHVLMVRH